MFKLSRIASYAIVTAFAAATPSNADMIDIFDHTKGNDNFKGQPFQTTFECIRTNITNFLAPEASTIKERQVTFTGISENYNAMVHFSGEQAGSEMVTIDWINVTNAAHPDAKTEYAPQFNSHVNLLGIPSEMIGTPNTPYSFIDYNDEHVINEIMGAEVLYEMLKSCPTGKPSPSMS